MTAAVNTPERRRTRSTPARASRTQQCLALLCLALALVCLYLGAQMLSAALANYRTEQFLQHWTEKAQAPTPQAWRAAFEMAARAVAQYPVGNGRYLDQLGQVHAWQMLQLPVAAAAAEPSRRAALQAYQQALEVRPGWPNTWARVAHTHYTLGQFDAAFALALEHANRLGPYRQAVQQELASIGLRAWPLLSTPQRVSTLASARQVLNGRPSAARKLRELARALGLEETLCMNALPKGC